jgi:hypothetical protein
MHTYTQRDIIKVRGDRLPENIDPHPFLIINCETVISCDSNIRRYLGVMLTHTKIRDRYTFEVTPDMIDGALNNSFRQIRTNIIASFRQSDISPDSSVYIGKMKPIYFKQVVEQITNYILSIDKN